MITRTFLEIDVEYTLLRANVMHFAPLFLGLKSSLGKVHIFVLWCLFSRF